MLLPGENIPVQNLFPSPILARSFWTIRDTLNKEQGQELMVIRDAVLQAGRQVWQEDKAVDDTAFVLLRYTGLTREPEKVA